MKVAGVDRCVFLLDSCSATKVYMGPLLVSKFDHLTQSTQRINVCVFQMNEKFLCKLIKLCLIIKLYNWKIFETKNSYIH